MAVPPKKTTNLPSKAVRNVVPRKNEVLSIRSLLSFLNSTLDCELRSMDDLKTGAVYCQLMHKLYPETIPIRKVKFYTNNRSDFEANFRLLNTSFEKLRITRYMTTEELILGHNQVHFCNWMYKFFQANDIGTEYDAKKVRKGSQIGLSKRIEVTPFSTGSMNPMHKSQSMVFNYARNPAKFERRNSLDIQVSRPSIFKNIQQEKQTKQPNPKPSQKKKISKTSQFLAESKNVSLPLESEDELELCAQKCYFQNQFAKKLYNSNTQAFPKHCPQIHQSKCGNAACEYCERETGDLRSQVQNLQSANERLNQKLKGVEHILNKYTSNPSVAVRKLNDLFQQSPQVSEVSSRRSSRDTYTVEGFAKDQLHTRDSEEFHTCNEFSPNRLTDKDATSLHPGHDEHALRSKCHYPSKGSRNICKKRLKMHCQNCGASPILF
ncbi:uncharacterized protein LOC6526983 [Drosophila yakuba]|uniref:Calponin-homology (CH) domain-containing protein n=1 Tax=Drosophila yakuba TaxID=7245 RepID=B4NZW4_DROYA|nr:uncharacterized protein LOC6526983 [Drosophila yakuba]EDW87791.1 uncharacterized protein Dyak_GE18379 [Drosophila yakuba]